MRVLFEEDVRRGQELASAVRAAPAMRCLLDLHLPCNMRCKGCEGQPDAIPLTGAASRSLAEGLVREAERVGAPRLELALFGGEPLLEADAVLTLSARVRRACERQDIAYAGHLITNGTLLSELAPRRLEAAGLTRLQITLDGGRVPHDRSRRMADGSGSWRRIVAGLKRVAGATQVVIRANAKELTPDVEELLGALDREGLLSSRGAAVALYVARAAPYPQQARELLRIFALLQADAAGESPAYLQ